MLLPSAFEHTPSRPQETDECQDAQRNPQAPLSQVLGREPHRSPGPLQGGWEVNVSGSLGTLLLDIRHPLRVGFQAKEAGSLEGIRLQQAKDKYADERCCAEVEKTFQQPG